MKPLLLNIRYIQTIDASKLANCHTVPGVGIFLRMWRNFSTLPLTDLAEYSVESSLESNGRTYKHAVSAHLDDYVNLDYGHWCYLLTTVDGHRYLVGNNEHPYPVSNTTMSMPAGKTEKSGCTLSVTYTDTLGLMPVLD